MECIYPHNKEWAVESDRTCNEEAAYFLNGNSLCAEHAGIQEEPD